MKKIYLLLASLSLLVFTGCDAILDAAYPEYAPQDEFIGSNYDYGFTIDGLPSVLSSYYDEYTEYFPIVHPNGEEKYIMNIEFKVLDNFDNNPGYGYNYGYINTYMYDDFYSIFNSPNNDSKYKELYDFYTYDYDEWDSFTMYDYFHLDLSALDSKINEGWWDGFNMRLQVRVIYSDGYEAVQTFDINID